MTQKERLIKLMKEVNYPAFPYGNADYNFGTQHPDHVFERVAEHLLVNGVLVNGVLENICRETPRF